MAHFGPLGGPEAHKSSQKGAKRPQNGSWMVKVDFLKIVKTIMFLMFFDGWGGATKATRIGF